MISALHIFCDFDGTIASSDIGDGLFERFGVREPWQTQLLAREISVRDYWLAMAANVREPLTLASIDEYLASIPIDPGFAELIALARSENIPFTIVSDGFDLYIHRYLAMHGEHDLDVRCNHAELNDDGRLVMSFPLVAEGCDCFCAACKRNVVLTTAHPDERIIYIGDGISDYCPAEHADVIFAKKKLAAYCNEHRLPHYPYNTLTGVAHQMRNLLARRKIRPRHQAALKRQRAWESE